MRFKILKQGGYNSGGISETGGNMSGPLVLAANPTENLHAASKSYVDTALGNLNAASLTSGLIPAERLPAMTGDITNVAGSNSFSLSDTGISPGTYAKVTVNAKGRITNGYPLAESDIPNLDWSKIVTGKPTTVAGYGITDAVPSTGGTLTGDLVVNTSPSNPLHIVTKAYVDSLAQNNTSGMNVNVGDVVRKITNVTPAGFLRCNGGQVSRTTYSALFNVIKDPYTVKATVDYTSYSAMGAGTPWKQQYDINSLQSGDITGWTTSGSLDSKNTINSLIIVTKNKVHAIGGNAMPGGSLQNVVNTATIRDDGTLTGWSASTPFPYTISYGQAVVTKNRVYVFGGFINGSYTATVYTALINADGTLGAWTTSENSLPTPVGFSQIVVTKNRVYSLGGANSSGSITAVYTAPINSDGTLGVWTTSSNSLPVAIRNSQVVVTKNRAYLLGGDVNGTNSSVVYTAVINSDGTLGAWSNANNNLPGGIAYSQAIVTKNKVYMLGGHNGSPVSTVYTAPVNADGTLGTWSTSTSLPAVLSNSQAIVTKGRVYLLGGSTSGESSPTIYTATIAGGTADYSIFHDGTINKFDGSDISGSTILYDTYDDFSLNTQPGSGQPWKNQYEINSSHTGDTLSAWTTTTSLPTTITESNAVVTKNRVYLLGGHVSNNQSSAIYTAPINADGTLGTWTTAGNLPISISSTQAIVAKNRVYIIGPSTIYSAPINTDGTLGVWSLIGNAPSNAYDSQVVVIKNRLYIFSGLNTISCIINDDGTLSNWTTAATFTDSMYYGQAIVIKNRVYILGSVDSSLSLPSNKIYYAPINADGTLGNWTLYSTMPTRLCEFQFFVSKNTLFIIGGCSQFTYGSARTDVYYCAIQSDGSLGAWLPGNSLPVAMFDHQLIATKNRLYLLGGADTVTNISTVYTATISGGLNDYSPYYDGTITAIEPNNFKLPDYSNKELPGSYSYIKY